MSIKILTKNSIDNTNIDGARQNHFSAGMKSGVVKGSLNEGRFFASASNIIALDSCVLLISGHQIVIDSVQYITLSNKPATPTRYSMIAEISVNDNSEPTFRLFIQASETELIQQNLFNTEKGVGTYQIKIGNFTLDTNGEIQETNRIVDVISGGGAGASADIEFNASAETISSDLHPEVNVDYNEETKKYDMHLKIPSGTGTKVSVGGVVQTEFNADTKADKTEVDNKTEILINGSNVDILNFSSDPQNQIDNLGWWIEQKPSLDAVYPVGSVYLSVQDTSPALLFGGSWELLPENSALWTAREDDIFAGVKIPAGLPNITGDVDNIWACKTFDTSPIASGALSLGSQITNGSAGGNGWQMYLHELYFNASKSNSIYGNSTTVQPPAYTVFAWKRVA